MKKQKGQTGENSMGGNALSIETSRLSKPEFFSAQFEVVSALLKYFDVNVKIRAIAAYAQKETFGDLDILVSKPENYLDNDFIENLLEYLKQTLGTTEYFKNSDVFSFDYLVPGGQVRFQIDLIFIEADRFEYALGYFSFNDLGNLIGRTAHKMGLAHKHNGLYYYVRDGDYLIDQILLTSDYGKALEFLGYDFSRFEKGFDKITDIFEYVAASKYFNTSIFLLENRNAISRVRDRKRKTYTEFLAWCASHSDSLPKFEYPEDKADWIPLIKASFPAFTPKLDACLARVQDDREAKKKFNGEKVSLLTGLTSKDLGAFIKSLKFKFGTENEFKQWVLSTDPVGIDQAILTHFNAYQKS